MKKLSDKDQVRLYKLHESIDTWDLTNKNGESLIPRTILLHKRFMLMKLRFDV